MGGAEAVVILLLVVGLGSIFFFGLVYLVIYNGLISKKNRVEQSFAGMDVQLKKRYDLIPNLVDSVRQYMTHERETLESITRARAEAMQSSIGSDQRVGLDNQISGFLGRIMLHAENYPDLKASENFIHLQRSLNEVEEQLSASRRAFNASVTEFNNGIEMFPSSLVASTMGLERKKVFEIPETERANIDVGRAFGSARE